VAHNRHRAWPAIAAAVTSHNARKSFALCPLKAGRPEVIGRRSNRRNNPIADLVAASYSALTANVLCKVWLLNEPTRAVASRRERTRDIRARAGAGCVWGLGGTVRFPSVERFVLSYVAGSPLAGPVFKADDAAREALIADVRNALRKYTSSTELAFPIAAHLLSAKVSAA
jgi:hypothetical protein